MTKKTSNLKLNKVLWVDLEMTGLSPTDDLILEVAAIVTDWNFKEIATYQGVIKNKPSEMNERMIKNAAFWEANPESKNGLINQNKNGKSLKIIERELLDFIDDNFESDMPVLLAGNSVHMDRRFIAEKWHKLDKRLYYRMLDVSAWKVVFEYKFNKKFMKPDAHRALDDIRGSIVELQYYLDQLK